MYKSDLLTAGTQYDFTLTDEDVLCYFRVKFNESNAMQVRVWSLDYSLTFSSKHCITYEPMKIIVLEFLKKEQSPLKTNCSHSFV